MNIFSYLNEYKDYTFKEKPFNELDGLILGVISYFPFKRLKNKKKIITTKRLQKLLSVYIPPKGTSERYLNYFRLLTIVVHSNRYKKAKYAYYQKMNIKNESKQFHAITIIFPRFVYVSFGGTDGTLTGWKEDFDMSYLDIVPSEIEAIKYANTVAKAFIFKKFIFGGHSKGGRLAITSAKNFVKKNKLINIYAFDAPNYPSRFYDDQYYLISNLVKSYAPSQSIIGRLMKTEKEKTIIASEKNLLSQHDMFNWKIEDNHFIYLKEYDTTSSHIINLVNEAFDRFDDHDKHLFVNALFEILDKLDMEQLPNENLLIPYITKRFALIKSSWKEMPKEAKSIIKKIIFKVALEYFFFKNLQRKDGLIG